MIIILKSSIQNNSQIQYRKILLRNLRTIRCGLNILYSYKVKFNADNAEQIHENIAEDIYRTCLFNDGLYVKFGQGMASVDHLLPPPYFKWLSLLQDKAKQVSFEEIKEVIEGDLGKPMEEIFQSFDKKAVASASIAQVHRAVLKTGEQVAVKVQKPNIKHQFNSDMIMHWVICAVLQYAFDLPLLQFQDNIESNLAKEIDFRIELQNTEQARYALEKCKRQDVYIPKIWKNLNNQRILISEWIDGIKVTHVNEIQQVGLDTRQVLQTVIDYFAEQIFISGFIHCDPHPGNIFVRKHPNNQKTHQVVILDFGLSLKISNQFRIQYAQFWKALFLQDQAEIRRITRNWGIYDEELFASMQLFRPFKANKPLSQKITKEEVLEMQFKMKDDIKKLMKETDMFPQDLLFLNRNMNLVRSVNKKCGSLVNRVNVMARWASKGTTIKYDMMADYNGSISDKIQLNEHKWSIINLFWFETRLFINSLIYRIVDFWMKIKGKRGFEEFIDDKQKQIMQDMYGNYGFKTPDENTFDA